MRNVARTIKGAAMLFNSFPFIFLFLPASLVLFYGLARVDRRLATCFLSIASLCFYGFWSSRYVLLLISSICGNYVFSEAIVRKKEIAPLAARSLFGRRNRN